MGWMDDRCCWACQKSLHRISVNESLSVCRWIGVSAHICVCFEPLCRAAFLQAQSETVCAFVTVQPSPGATAGLWQQPLQISHSCVTNSWPRNSRAASYLQTHSHTRMHTPTYTHTHSHTPPAANFSRRTPLSNSSAVKWDYNSVCSRPPAPSTLPIYPTSPIMAITCH